MARTNKEEKAEVRLIVHYNRAMYDRDSIRKYLESHSTPWVTIIVTNVKAMKPDKV